jgi:hypothetical protein
MNRGVSATVIGFPGTASLYANGALMARAKMANFLRVVYRSLPR